MSEDGKGGNIIVSTTQDLWDYKADPAYAEAVSKTTEYVAGVIDIVALIVYFTGKSSVALFRWLNETGTQAVELGKQANALYYEKNLNEKTDQLIQAIRGKIVDYRQPSSTVYTLDDSSVTSEPDSMSNDGDNGEMAA